MDDLNVLVTGSGAPGIAGTVYSLKNNFDQRGITVVGTDISEDVVGRYLCDEFRVIPRPNMTAEYLEALREICQERAIDVIIPQNTAELCIISANRDSFRDIGVEIVVSSEEVISKSNDKSELSRISSRLGIPTPENRLVCDMDHLVSAAEDLGWPKEKVVIKPPNSNGMRGVRIIDETVDLKRLYYEEKPTSLFVRMDQVRTILGDRFAPIMVMEYLPGVEYTIDVFHDGEYLTIPRRRDRIVSGITFSGTVEKRTDVMQWSAALAQELDLDFCFGFQFKLDKDGVPKLLECNPRVQGTMVLSTFAGANIIYGSVKRAMGEVTPRFDVEWGTRIMRYWGAVGISSSGHVRL